MMHPGSTLVGRCKGNNPTRWSAFRKSDVSVRMGPSSDASDAANSNSANDEASVCVRAYKNECDSQEGKRGSGVCINVSARFAGVRAGEQPGVLVGEVYYVGSEIGDAAKRGINVSRFKVEASEGGMVECAHVARPLQNSHVYMDVMLGLASGARETSRALRVELHAPDEVDVAFWKPIFTCSFPMSVGFSRDSDWIDFHSRLVEEGVQAHETNEKLSRVQAAMREDKARVMVGEAPSSECRLLAPVRPSEEVWRSRRVFLGGVDKAEADAGAKSRLAFRRLADANSCNGQY